MRRLYITLTHHCIKKIQERNKKHKKRKEAIFFWKAVFDKFIQHWEYKWRKVRMKYTKDWKYRITDWVHQFIFSKPFKIEYILITYVKREYPLWEQLRRWERYIQ